MKKLLTLVLAAVMLLGCCAMAYAAPLDDAADAMKELQVFTGDPDGNMRLDDSLARREFFKISAALSGHQPVAYRNAFTDIAAGDWFAGYAQALADAGMLLGYADGTALPNNVITQRELGVMLLRLLGEAPEWSKADDAIIAAGLAANIDYNGAAAVTRGEAVLMCANLKADYIGIVSAAGKTAAEVLTAEGTVTVPGLKAKVGDVVEGSRYGVLATADKLSGAKGEDKVWALNMSGTAITIGEDEYRISEDTVFFGLIEKDGATKAAIIDNGALRLFDNLKGDSISIVKADGEELEVAVVKNPVFNIEKATVGVVDEIYQSKGEYYITFIGCDMQFRADEEDEDWEDVDDYDAVVFFAEDGLLTYVDTLYADLCDETATTFDEAALKELSRYEDSWKQTGKWKAISNLDRDLQVFRCDGISIWYDDTALIYLVDKDGVTLGDSSDIKKDSRCMVIADEEQDALLIFVRNDK
ncbi:MAG: S-layer homology domain-containing protein [Firmicutes bacterium]|nr:S-layer homology domain-containing protein [Bacillota bacterium]